MSSSRAPQRSGHVPILPASTESGGPEGAAGRLASASVSRKRNKRTQITPVACQPCQQRKSKCDGARPACSSCAARKRTDCWYNAAGDQRRTASLKQRIRDLEQETQDLREALAIATGGNPRAGESAAAAELRTRQWQRAQHAQRTNQSPMSRQTSITEQDETDFDSQADITSDLDPLDTTRDTTSLASVTAGITQLTGNDPGSHFATAGGFTADSFQPVFTLAEGNTFGGTAASGQPIMQGWPWTGGPGDPQWPYDPNAPHGRGMGGMG